MFYRTLIYGRLFQQYLSGTQPGITGYRYFNAGNATGGRELYSFKLLKKHQEIIPLLVIVFGGIAVLTGFIFRNTMTRDDVRFYPKGKFGYEEESNYDKQRKFLAYNQDYKSPEGLKELYETLKEN